MKAAWPHLVLVAIVHLAIAWPGADRRGVIGEEAQPYLARHPRALDLDERGEVVILPPNDTTQVGRFVGTTSWPEVAWVGRYRTWPLFVRAHQTALGTYVGLALGPLLGGGIAGVRRSSVLLGLALVLLVWALARALRLARPWATVAALGCALSPGLWFFSRTGYAFELMSRVLMLATLWCAAPERALSWRRAVAVGTLFALAILSRATIALTLAPLVLIMLVHPKRMAGTGRIAAVFGIGAGAPLAIALTALWLLPFAAAPGANLPLGALAGRTLTAPAMLVGQLAWAVDARSVLVPLLECATQLDARWPAALLGAGALALALRRWWLARAHEAERLLVCALLANALGGAWLYGNPLQFQLGMAIEPLLALAVAAQLADLARPRLAAGITGLLLVARALTLVAVLRAEQRSDNPIFSDKAQRALVGEIESQHVDADRLVTITYDHVGVIETWSAGRVRPLHAWRILRRAPRAQLAERWRRLLDSRPVCHVLMTRLPHLFAGAFTDLGGIDEALLDAVAARGARIEKRTPIRGNGGGAVFDLVELAPCASR